MKRIKNYIKKTLLPDRARRRNLRSEIQPKSVCAINCNSWSREKGGALSDRRLAPVSTSVPPSPLGLNETRRLFIHPDPRDSAAVKSTIGGEVTDE